MQDGFSYTGVFPPPETRLKLFLFTPVKACRLVNTLSAKTANAMAMGPSLGPSLCI